MLKYAEVIKAWADGESIQFKNSTYNPNTWVDWDLVNSTPDFTARNLEWRIKPNSEKWYRVGKCVINGNSYIVVSTCEQSESDTECSSTFVEWLTDRIVYE